jgi:diadenosine tetraphosphate (Ap4A) HIT family hydrolase
MTQAKQCELCQQVGGELVYEDAQARVVLVDDAHYPGFCRVIWRKHVKEMSDLDVNERTQMMSLVWHVEQVLRQEMQPEKINLASLGNMTPHLHWHVIPRFIDDAHFPQPVWGEQQRDPSANPAHAARVAQLPALAEALRVALVQ